MSDEIILDKTIIYLDSLNGVYENVNQYDFYIDIQEPIKNAMYIKILDTNLNLSVYADTINYGIINGTQVNDLDPIYIGLNNYHRVTTKIDNNVDVAKFFDVIVIDKSKYISQFLQAHSGNAEVPLNYSSVKDESSNGFDVSDPNVYVLNPMEPNLKRFKIRLVDLKNNIITRNISTSSNIHRFTMKICVYSSRKKITMR